MIIPRERDSFNPWIVGLALLIAALIFGSGLALGLAAGRGTHAAKANPDPWPGTTIAERDPYEGLIERETKPRPRTDAEMGYKPAVAKPAVATAKYDYAPAVKPPYAVAAVQESKEDRVAKLVAMRADNEAKIKAYEEKMRGAGKALPPPTYAPTTTTAARSYATNAAALTTRRVEANDLVPDVATLGGRVPPTASRYNNTPPGRDNGTATGYGEISKTTGQPRTQYVSGYVRSDGTYVAPYYRSVTPKDNGDVSGEAVVGHTPTGLPLHVGPRGGVYHYSASGNKVYEKKK